MDLIDSSMLHSEEVAVILCGGWAVWSERNAREHDDHVRSVTQSVKWTADITMDLNISGRSSASATRKSEAKWYAPVGDVLKLNVDASYVPHTSEGATGLLLRDHEGKMLRGQAIWYGHAASTLIMEALAVRDGVRLACDIGISKLILESDAKEVVKLWRDRDQGRSEIASVLQEIEELSGNMEFFQLSFVGREANVGAHLCAKRASASRTRCLWINYVPSFLADCLLKDCNPAG